jgi:hypothetical protein
MKEIAQRTRRTAKDQTLKVRVRLVPLADDQTGDEGRQQREHRERDGAKRNNHREA